MASGGGGGMGQLGQLMKPMMEDLHLAPPNSPKMPLDAQPALPTQAAPQTTDRLAFLRAFGIQG
jgi:hypothetical protein